MILHTAGIRYVLAASYFVATTTPSHSQPSLPASFQTRTIHSPAGAEIFVRFGGTGPVVVL
jgi:hypothetical protein